LVVNEPDTPQALIVENPSATRLGHRLEARGPVIHNSLVMDRGVVHGPIIGGWLHF
jgi:hypothetical protein